MTINNVAVLLNNQGVGYLTRSNGISFCGTDEKMSEITTSTNNVCYSTRDTSRLTTTMIKSEDIDRATALFEQALDLIIRSAEIYRNDGGLQYHKSDGYGMIQFEEEVIGKRLISSLDLQDTGVKVNGIDDKSFIHWTAVKICNFSNMQAEMSMPMNENEHDGKDYRHLSTTIFHSMVCIYNLGLCYQYKGIQSSSRKLLEAAVDHYMQAYELGTRFKLQHIDQYTLLMATMNNMATTYAFLNEPSRRDVCNNYLLSTLMLLTTSEEGRENHQAAVQFKDTLSRARQRTYQSFMSNVMYLISEDNVASAA